MEKEQKEVRTLAAGASQDVSDYKAALQGHTSSLNALRETQLEQAADLKRLSSAVEKQSSTLEKQSSALEKQSSTLEKQSSVLEKQSSVLEKVLAELQTMREERFQQSVDFRALQETQTRHYGEYHRAFAVINARLGYAIEALERPGRESGQQES